MARRTVKIRALVRIDDRGEWIVYGTGDAEGSDTPKAVRSKMDDSLWDYLPERAEAEVWVTAEVTVPAKKRRRPLAAREADRG